MPRRPVCPAGACCHQAPSHGRRNSDSERQIRFPRSARCQSSQLQGRKPDRPQWQGPPVRSVRELVRPERHYLARSHLDPSLDRGVTLPTPITRSPAGFALSQPPSELWAAVAIQFWQNGIPQTRNSAGALRQVHSSSWRLRGSRPTALIDWRKPMSGSGQTEKDRHRRHTAGKPPTAEVFTHTPHASSGDGHVTCRITPMNERA